ncbi:MAG: DUF4402 domain-containing protein [Chitinophagaceae bacterium]
MNLKNKMITSAITILGFSTISNAQGSVATATAAATIVTPLLITFVTNMNFGNVAVSATVPGTVVLATDGSRTRTGGAQISVATPGTVTAAAFTVSGTVGYTYAITLPGSVTLTNTTLETMTATVFTSNPAATSTLTAGDNPLLVGATLNVAAAQAEGVYTSTPFDVTVNYN